MIIFFLKGLLQHLKYLIQYMHIELGYKDYFIFNSTTKQKV
jgi:hypothetical protein